MPDSTSEGTTAPLDPPDVGGDEDEGAMVGVVDPDEVDPPDVVLDEDAIVDPTPELVVLWESIVHSLSPGHVVDV